MLGEVEWSEESEMGVRCLRLGGEGMGWNYGVGGYGFIGAWISGNGRVGKRVEAQMVGMWGFERVYGRDGESRGKLNGFESFLDRMRWMEVWDLGFAGLYKGIFENEKGKLRWNARG